MGAKRLMSDTLARQINRTQYSYFLLLFLFAGGEAHERRRATEMLSLLEADPKQIFPNTALGQLLRVADKTSIPEYQDLLLRETLEKILSAAAAEYEQLLAKLGIAKLSADALRLFTAAHKRALDGVAYVQLSVLEPLMDIRRFSPPLLANSLVSFNLVRGMEWHTPERWFYRDMCWHYNTAMAAFNAYTERLKAVRAGHGEEKDLLAIGSRTWRHFRSVVIAAVTFVESIVNALWFEFLHARRYEAQRASLHREMKSASTSKNRMKDLERLFGGASEGSGQESDSAFAPLEWKLKYVPTFLSGTAGSMPDTTKTPISMLLAVNAVWRNSFIHPSYEKKPLPKLPKLLERMLTSEFGDVPSKLDVILESSVQLQEFPQFMTITVDSAVETAERLYQLSFGRNHGYLWWLRPKTADGGFPDPDDWEVLREKFEMGSQ